MGLSRRLCVKNTLCTTLRHISFTTLRTCTRGKVINFVRLSVCLSFSTKIARSVDSDLRMVSKCDEIVGSGKKRSSYYFLTLDISQKRCKLCEYNISTPIDHPY